MRRLIALCSLLLSCCLTEAQSFDIYVSDAGNFNNPPWQIIKYDASGSNPQRVTNTQLAWPQDILFLEDSNLMLVSNLNSNQITKYNASSGAYLGVFASGISGPTRMKIGADSSLYVLQWSGNGRVKRFDLSGNFLGDYTTVAVNQSIGMDWDSQGNLYVSSYNGDHIRKFDTAGVDQGLFISSSLAGPTNIWFNSNGEMIVNDYDAGAIKRFSSTGIYLGILASGLSQNEGVDFLPNGSILIGNGGNGSIKEFDSSLVFVGDKVTPGLGGLIRPNAVRIRPTTITGSNPIKQESPSYHLAQNQLEVNFNGKGEKNNIRMIDMLGRVLWQGSCLDYCTFNLPVISSTYCILEFRAEGNILSQHKIFQP